MGIMGVMDLLGSTVYRRGVGQVWTRTRFGRCLGRGTCDKLSRTTFGLEVFVRAVVEISNYCRENCSYCGMRRSNRSLHRFRAKHEKLAELLIHHRPASVTDVNIQAGEDPVAVREVALPLIRTLRRE